MKRSEDVFQSRIYCTDAYKNLHIDRIAFPIIVDIEPTNACNLDCIFCARQTMKRPIAFLPLEKYKIVIDEMKNYRQTSIRFSGWGEPTIHPQIIDFIKYAHEKDILTHLTTNATLINSEISEALLRAGLNKIKFSLQGLTESEYDRMRQAKASEDSRCGYKNVVRNIEGFINNRNALGAPCHIQVSVSMLKKEQENNGLQRSFYDRWHSKVDSIWGLGKIGVYGGKPLLTSFNRVKEIGRVSVDDVKDGRPLRLDDVNRGKQCAELYSKVSIGADGKMKACCDDADNKLVVGEVGIQTIKEVWEGDKLKRLREALQRGNPKLIPLFCLNCDNYL